MIEEWRDIKGFEGRYMISNMGRVWGIKRGRTLSIQTTDKGYKKVMLSLGANKLHFVWVHRLVAAAFCEGYFEGAVVNHKDSNPSNNIYTNLEWVTQKDNIQHCIRSGRFKYPPKNWGNCCKKKP